MAGSSRLPQSELLHKHSPLYIRFGELESCQPLGSPVCLLGQGEPGILDSFIPLALEGMFHVGEGSVPKSWTLSPL